MGLALTLLLQAGSRNRLTRTCNAGWG